MIMETSPDESAAATTEAAGNERSLQAPLLAIEHKFQEGLVKRTVAFTTGYVGTGYKGG